MKFCSVCGVALAQPTEPVGQSEQNSPVVAYNPAQLPEKTKKKSNKLAISLILLALFVAWLSNGEGSDTRGVSSEPSGSTSPSEPITQQETLDQNIYDAYRPLTANLETTLNEMADYAFAEDAESLVASCFDLKDLSEQGLAIPPTGNLDFDQAWGNAMDAGVNSANSCIVEDFDGASTYITEMSGYISSATSYIE